VRRRFSPLALVAGVLAFAVPALAGAASASAALPPIGHVFVIVLENESASTTFGAGSPAPYLSSTLRSEGAYLPNYYGVGHESNDNYIAMISGQAPTAQNQADCQFFDNLEPGTIGSYGQAEGSGCVYPSGVSTIADQMTAAGLTWRDYNEDMGADPTREASECGHPGINSVDNTQKATADDEYATRHDPFVYFHSIIDDTALCDSHVVNLSLLPHDLSSAADTPNYVFITPDLCDDGHDSPCANGQPGGLAQADAFLRQWVPQITSSPAFTQQHGLLIITFDEAATSDTSSCCGEIPGPDSPEPGINGPGGGDVGAVLLSPCIAPGTVSTVPYNHYTMLRSVEDIFGLPHLGYAGLPGETSFGSDIFNQPCTGTAAAPPPPTTKVRAPAIASSAAAGPRIPISWTASDAGAVFTVQVRDTNSSASSWRTLLTSTTKRSLTFAGRLGQTYEFQVRAVSAAGAPGSWSSATTIVPSGLHPAGSHYRGAWQARRLRGAWEGRAIVTSTPGARFTLRYVGGELAVIGDRSPQGGRIRITFAGRSHTIDLHSARLQPRRVLFLAHAPVGHHRLTIRVLSGTVALEGFAIASRQSKGSAGNAPMAGPGFEPGKA
jgi:phosphatidylinositol-3-phosphatase